MSKIVQIGRKTKLVGKRVPEILCRLKNFGIGRIIEKIPVEPREKKTFYIIKAAFPQMDEELGYGRVYAEEYLDEQRRPGIIEMDTYPEQYRLIHRHEEAFYRKVAETAPVLGKDVPKVLLPQYIKMPPVMAEVLNRMHLKKSPCLYIKGLNKEDYGYDQNSLLEYKVEAVHKLTEIELVTHEIADEDNGVTPPPPPTIKFDRLKQGIKA